MENYRRLFKNAERLKPDESMWKRIAAKAGEAAKSDVQEDVREARPWRLAASLAVGLGMVAALAVLFREPPGMAVRDGSPEAADRQLATAAEEATAAGGLQEWHADLGIPAGERFEEMSADGWADDTALLNPLLEE